MTEQVKFQTVPEDWERALVVMAHPDDIEYGAASAIARWTSQGKQVAYVMVTRGEAGIDSMAPEKVGPLREAEERSSAAVVGVEIVEFLDHRDGVVEYGLPLRKDISRAIRKHRPEVLITGLFGLARGNRTLNQADHREVGLAVIDASRDAGNRWIFPELLDEGLEPWNGIKMICVSGSSDPTHAVDVTDFIDKGVESLQEHRVYIDNLVGRSFDPDMFLRMNLNAVGELFGCDYAVSFEIFKI